ncbi:MAG: hypothetical protein C4306_08350 [Thermoleophilia bacterium]
MPDVFSYEIVEAFGLPGCPLCRVAARDEERWMDTFWREGSLARELRRRFYAAGGFCRRHAWLFHRRVAANAAAAVIADVYGNLADRDLERLAAAAAALSRGRRRGVAPARAGRCPACVEAERALERDAFFLAQALREEPVRQRYAASQGLCYAHLVPAVAAARALDAHTAHFLVRDFRGRLQRVRDGLTEYDRKRDYRRAGEPKGDEQRSWTDVIRLYVGEDVER